jgi:GDSL-like Lipase/Acylhydrolase family
MLDSPATPVAGLGSSDPGRRERRIRREGLALLREARRWPTLLLVLATLLTAIPGAILLTPGQEVVTFGQHIVVKARPPDLSPSGPAQIVQIGNTSLDIPRLHVIGPLRPRLEMGPAVRSPDVVGFVDPSRSGGTQSAAARTIGGGWVRWCTWGYLVALGIAVGLAAVASSIRLVRGQSRRRIRRMAVVSLAVTSMVWAGSCAATAAAAAGLRDVSSFADLVGQYRLSPTPVGPKLYGYEGAVIGDSRAARVGGPPVAEPTRDDADCNRSADSLAAEIGISLPGRVLNLACPSATILSGLMGPQPRSGRQLPPQVAILKQVQDLKFVVVVVGPNDLWWSDMIAYCYGAAVCNDKLMRGDYESAGLPDASCPDARGPAGVKGLTPEKITFLTSLNSELNEVLAAGAEKYGFDVAEPHLGKLCQASADGLGPDLQGIDGPNPFHPTATGSIRLAASVLRLIEPTPK